MQQALRHLLERHQRGEAGLHLLELLQAVGALPVSVRCGASRSWSGKTSIATRPWAACSMTWRAWWWLHGCQRRVRDIACAMASTRPVQARRELSAGPGLSDQGAAQLAGAACQGAKAAGCRCRPRGGGPAVGGGRAAVSHGAQAASLERRKVRVTVRIWLTGKI